MRDRRLVLVALVLVVLLAFFAGGGAELVTDAVSIVVNGARIGPKTSVGANGLVAADPGELALAAGLDLETYALARALQSEHGQDPDAYLVAIAWAIRNKAVERGVSVFALLTDGKGTAGDGLFGHQNAAAGTKYAATDQDPCERHALIASQVIAGDPPDPTSGATHFFSPKAQDALAAKAETSDDPRYAGYAGRTAAVTLANWQSPGYLYPGGAELVIPPGIDGYRLSLFRRVG